MIGERLAAPCTREYGTAREATLGLGRQLDPSHAGWATTLVHARSVLLAHGPY